MRKVIIIPKPKIINTNTTTTTTQNQNQNQNETSPILTHTNTNTHIISQLQSSVNLLTDEVVTLKQQINDFGNKLDQILMFISTQAQAQAQAFTTPSYSCQINFSEWVESLQIERQNLQEIFISPDICEWVCNFIISNISSVDEDKSPICCRKTKIKTDTKTNRTKTNSDIFVYENHKWNILTDTDFSIKFINKLFVKIIRIFIDWKNENYNRISTNEKIATIYHTNNSKILSLNENNTKLKNKLISLLNK